MQWLFLQLLSRIRKWNEGKEGIKAREAYWMHKSLSGWRVCCFIVNGSVPLLRKSQHTRPETVLKGWTPKWRKRQKTLFCCFLFSSLPFLFNRSHTQLYNKQYFGYCFQSCFSPFGVHGHFLISLLGSGMISRCWVKSPNVPTWPDGHDVAALKLEII